MNKTFYFITFTCATLLLCTQTSSQTCKSYTFSNNKLYNSCLDLPYLNSFLHWNYNQSTSTVDLAFRYAAAVPSTWIVWSINPNGKKMIGCQALVAYQNSDGSMNAYTSSIDSYNTKMPQGSLSFDVPSISATFVNTEMTIFAKIALGSNMVNVDHVWQFGPMKGGTPRTHKTSGDNMRSYGTINFLSSAQTTSSTSGTGGGGDVDGDDGDGGSSSGSGSSSDSGISSRQKKKNVHGVLNAISWGLLMPMGIMFARYLKVFKTLDPAWFYLHITCQTSAYVIGIAGWATGLMLGDDGGETGNHGTIGAILSVGGMLQVFALLVRPKKDHKFRIYWNVYHHSVGYTVVILSIVNVYKGLEILDPDKKWKQIYTGFLILLGIIAVILEAITWIIVIKRRRSTAESQKAMMMHNFNGYNNHGMTSRNGHRGV